MKKEKMNILVIGSGGREHALSEKILKSKYCDKVYAIPGNELWECVNSINLDVNNNFKIIEFVKKNNIKLTIVGPEDVLKNGIVDEFHKNNLNIFAPTKKAAKIETSKDFSKKIMNKYNIPTANYKSFTNYNDAKKYIENISDKNFKIVIKSSNLAAGKGVLISRNKKESIDYVYELLKKNKYGKNNIVIIEEFMEGNEFSLMCLVNNDKIYPLPIVKDHKTIFDNNKGPNTGGMGVISNLDFLNKNDMNQAINDCIKPLVKGLINEKINYLGVIFSGIMKTIDNKFKVIEYNARWGDPETEIILNKLNCDILEFIISVINKEEFSYNIIPDDVNGIVVSAKGYPKSYIKNIDVSFIKNLKNVYYMGVKKENDKLLSTSGRIFMIYDNGKNPSEKIYKKLKKIIKTNELYYRNDIK